MKHTLILSAVLLVGAVAYATQASASEVVGTLYMGAPTAQTGTMEGTVGSPSAGGASGGGGNPLGGGIIGLGGTSEATNAFLVLTPVVNASGAVLGATAFVAPVGNPSAPSTKGRAAQEVTAKEDSVIALATMQDTSNQTNGNVAAVANGVELLQWVGGLLLLLVLLGLGYYLYTQSGSGRRQLP